MFRLSLYLLLTVVSVNLYAADSLPYDPSADPVKDLETAVVSAQSSDRKILLIVGGNWCSWCRELSRYVDANKSVKKALDETFVVVKVNFSEDKPNTQFLEQYPPIKGYPAFIILDSGGKFLGTYNTAKLEKDQSYSKSAFKLFIQQWQDS